MKLEIESKYLVWASKFIGDSDPMGILKGALVKQGNNGNVVIQATNGYYAAQWVIRTNFDGEKVWLPVKEIVKDFKLKEDYYATPVIITCINTMFITVEFQGMKKEYATEDAENWTNFDKIIPKEIEPLNNFVKVDIKLLSVFDFRKTKSWQEEQVLIFKPKNEQKKLIILRPEMPEFLGLMQMSSQNLSIDKLYELHGITVELKEAENVKNDSN